MSVHFMYIVIVSMHAPSDRSSPQTEMAVFAHRETEKTAPETAIQDRPYYRSAQEKGDFKVDG